MPQPFHAEVVASTQISPHFVRVTLSGSGMDCFSATGYDQWFRLFLPRAGESTPRLPGFHDDTGFRDWYRATPEPQRPIIRNYTVRSFDPANQHIDVDFVLHEDPGPAAQWARDARPGDIVGLYQQTAMFAPHPDADWYLFVCDATGLPAIAGCLGSLPDDRTCLAFNLVPTAADRQQLPIPAGSGQEWIFEDKETDPTAAIIHAVKNSHFPSGRVQALLLGESALVTTLRRHLVNDRGVPKDHVKFCGYWRRDQSH